MTQSLTTAMRSNVHFKQGGSMLEIFIDLGECVKNSVSVYVKIAVDDLVVVGVEGRKCVSEMVQWMLDGKWRSDKE